MIEKTTERLAVAGYRTVLDECKPEPWYRRLWVSFLSKFEGLAGKLSNRNIVAIVAKLPEDKKAQSAFYSVFEKSDHEKALQEFIQNDDHRAVENYLLIAFPTKKADTKEARDAQAKERTNCLEKVMLKAVEYNSLKIMKFFTQDKNYHPSLQVYQKVVLSPMAMEDKFIQLFLMLENCKEDGSKADKMNLFIQFLSSMVKSEDISPLILVSSFNAVCASIHINELKKDQFFQQDVLTPLLNRVAQSEDLTSGEKGQFTADIRSIQTQ